MEEENEPDGDAASAMLDAMVELWEVFHGPGPGRWPGFVERSIAVVEALEREDKVDVYASLYLKRRVRMRVAERPVRGARKAA
jgi:hypothetical protein